MDAATIVTIAASITGVGVVLAGWIWDTRNMVGKVESDLAKQIGEVKNELERTNTMVEPFWNALCENLPAILKMHNSPDPLAAVIHGDPTIEEVDELICRIKCDLEQSIEKGDDAKAYGFILALAVAKARRSLIVKQGEKQHGAK